jgi:hypothetical protein
MLVLFIGHMLELELCLAGSLGMGILVLVSSLSPATLMCGPLPASPHHRLTLLASHFPRGLSSICPGCHLWPSRLLRHTGSWPRSPGLAEHQQASFSCWTSRASLTPPCLSRSLALLPPHAWNSAPAPSPGPVGLWLCVDHGTPKAGCRFLCPHIMFKQLMILHRLDREP